MTYKVYTGPPGAESISPLEKDHALYKELDDLDAALAFASALKRRGSVPLLIEGDDGTCLRKKEIADALQLRERELARP